jgi:sulfate-transporting ATPase
MGLSPDVISALTWALGSAIAAFGMIIVAPITSLDVSTMPLFIVPALGAALVGQFDSLSLTVVGAIIIAVGEVEVGLVTSAPGWNEAAPLIAIVAVLVIRKPARYDRSDTASRLPMVGSGRIGGTALLGAGITLAAIGFLPLAWLNPLTLSIILGMVMLSVVVVTGYAAQLSLAQFGLAGGGAFLSTYVASHRGWPLWASMLVGVLLTIPLGLVVAIPALRVKGPSLAIASLALVVVISDLLPVVLQPGRERVAPLEIFGLHLDDLNHPTGFAIFCLVLFGLAAAATANVRRSAMGRRMLAIRTNPQAALALGVSPVKTKLYAFILGSVMAATCGAVLAQYGGFPGYGVFGPEPSIAVVLQTTIGGLGLIGGAIIGAIGSPSSLDLNGFPWSLGSKVVSEFFSPSNWISVITGFGVILVILFSPNGLAASVQRGFARGKSRIRTLWSRPARRREDAFAAALWAGRVRPGRRPSKLLTVEDISVSFGGVRALSGASLEVEPGEIVGLIGPNGAGKSTFIEAVCGATSAQTGSVSLGGTPIERLSSLKKARLGLARSFQSLELFEDMTVGENLLVACERPRRSAGLRELFWPKKVYITEAAARACRDFGLERDLGLMPRDLDHGRRRLVAIARALASDPVILFLDEPAAGLDAKQRDGLARTLCAVASEWKVGILLVEHDVDLVFRVCDRVTALVAGVAVASGRPEAVRGSPALIEAYLGRDQMTGRST